MQLSRFALPAVLFLASAVPFVAPTQAQAHERVRHEVRHHERRFHESHHYRHFSHYRRFVVPVFYRSRGCDPWRCYGRYDSGVDARCAADRLVHEGYMIRVGY